MNKGAYPVVQTIISSFPTGVIHGYVGGQQDCQL
jgi:hypothetical protein